MIMFKKISLYSYAYTDLMDGRPMVDRACDSRESYGFPGRGDRHLALKSKVTKQCVRRSLDHILKSSAPFACDRACGNG